jgi:phosphate transport system substrate-binding protein
VLTGEIRYWSDINPSFDHTEIQVVFDHAGSSTVSYLKNYFKLPEQLPPHFYAVKSNPEVIEYTKKNKQALGVIGVNWVSDHDDSMATRFMRGIKVLGLSAPDSAKAVEGEYFQPYQLYILQRTYPLVREVYVINSEPRSGLGTGFASFIAGNKGQSIINLSGLLPATRPVRIMEFK